MSSRSLLILNLLFKTWGEEITWVTCSLSAAVLRVVILHTSGQTAAKQGWHWGSPSTDPNPGSLCVTVGTAASLAPEKVSRGGFLSSDTSSHLAVSAVCSERDDLLGMRSNPWSPGLYSACYIDFFHSHSYQSSKDSSFCRNTFYILFSHSPLKQVERSHCNTCYQIRKTWGLIQFSNSCFSGTSGEIST